jgi:hypothetical protein
MRAIENGGFVHRDESYEIIGRDEGKSLNGFTKPVKNLVDRMQERGEIKLPTTAQPLLKAFYGDGETKSLGFVIPLNAVAKMREHQAKA